MNIPSITKQNNMGLVRYYLAFSVLIAHFNFVFGTEYFWPTSSYNAVGGFFALSGFLVYNSYLKSKDFKQYLIRRARRILPAYWFIVLLCAFGLATVSELPLKEYFSSTQWWKYLASNMIFLNFIEPSLPGVFTHNIEPAVNGSLWTMKIEWFLYISVPVAAWIVRRFREKYFIVFTSIFIISLIYRIIFVYLYDSTHTEIYNILGRQALGQLMYFYVGVLIRFKLTEFIRYKWLILGCCAVLLSFEPFLPYGYIYIPPLAVSALVIWFSMIGKWGVWAGSNDNVSYDIYLFHFPIIQLAFYLGMEEIFGTFLTLVISSVATVLLACFSWFVIGKKYLHKNRLTK